MVNHSYCHDSYQGQGQAPSRHFVLDVTEKQLRPHEAE